MTTPEAARRLDISRERVLMVANSRLEGFRIEGRKNRYVRADLGGDVPSVIAPWSPFRARRAPTECPPSRYVNGSTRACLSHFASRGIEDLRGRGLASTLRQACRLSSTYKSLLPGEWHMKKLAASLLMVAMLSISPSSGAWESPKIRARVTQWKTWWNPDLEIWRVNGWVRIRNKTDNGHAVGCRIDAYNRRDRRVGSGQTSQYVPARRAKGTRFQIYGAFRGSKASRKPRHVKIRRCWIIA
jgi:hypothetical protein